MALRVTHLSFVITAAIAMTTVMWVGATAQSGCTSAIMGLAPCLGFIQGGSSNPSSSCCSGLSGVVKNQAACLCKVLNGGGSSFGVSINQTQALALPGACKIETPPVSACNAVNNPGASPTAAPVGSPNESPADALTPEASETPEAGANPPTSSSTSSTGFGSKSKKIGSASDGNMIKSSLRLSLLVFIVSAVIRV